MNRRWLAWATGGVVAVAALTAGLYFGERASQETVSANAAAKAVAGLILPDPDGTPQAFSQWHGKVLVVNFWATWCAPCREEMPLFNSAQQQYGSRGVQFVGIAADSPEKVREMVAASPLGYPTVIAGYGAVELSQTLGNRLGALPYTVVLDRAGNVVYRQLGPFSEAKLNTILGQFI
jgi:thiol-disulfide isomerase/thioredoxin